MWEEGVPAMRSSTLSTTIIPAPTTTSATNTPHHITRSRTATSSSTIVSATRGATSSSSTYSSQNALTTRFIVTSSASATSQPSISTSHSPQASISFGSSQQSRTPTITPAFSHRPQHKPTRSLWWLQLLRVALDVVRQCKRTSLAPTSTHAATMTEPLPHSQTHLSSLSQSVAIILNAVTLDAPPAIQAAAYASVAGAVVGGP
ncbi:Hypothetical protein, putative [Bodo saltans]|uniref:Uncharacterized protein n=1 Tax=Bodo saltans TaxID=75058 RepID=A0A0S4J3B4_BODSA|nr:Hypothetical protein, putative [Bodo saltans]|eukprot:CUG85832.1 Hypothetical protein, putative [Bodo saltans]